MRSIARTAVLLLLIAGVNTLLANPPGHGSWLTQVPAKFHWRTNPYTDGDAVLAGEKLYEQHCAQCHGANGDGRDRKPALRTGRVRRATEGDLEWLLTNGSIVNGMPSWSRLPEQQRWQIVAYLKSLK